MVLTVIEQAWNYIRLKKIDKKIRISRKDFDILTIHGKTAIRSPEGELFSLLHVNDRPHIYSLTNKYINPVLETAIINKYKNSKK